MTLLLLTPDLLKAQAVQHAQDPIFFQISLEATEFDVQRALAEVMEQMRQLTTCTDALSSVELVLAEAMNNVVEHAYECKNTGEMALICQQIATGVRFTLTDHGKPVPDEVLLPRNRQLLPLETDDLPEGGFGWFLILDLAHEVQLRRVGQTTVLQLSIETA